MTNEPLSTRELPVERVHTFADLAELMRQVLTAAFHRGSPSMTWRMLLVVAGQARPSHADLTEFLTACEVHDGEWARWQAAWHRAASADGTPPVPRQAGPSHVDMMADAQREALLVLTRAGAARDRVRAELEAVRERTVRRLRDLRASVQFSEAVAIELEEIISAAHREVSAISLDVDALVPDPDAVEADHPADPALAWIRAVLRHVPPAIAARMLQSVPAETVDAIALGDPAILADLLRSVSSAEAAQWVPRWRPEARTAVCEVLDPAVCARMLELLPVPSAASTVAGLSPARAMDVLGCASRQTAAGWLLEIEHQLVAHLLQLVEVEDAARYLIEMKLLGLANYALVVRHMAEDVGRRCLHVIDRHHVERGHASDLIQQVDANRERRGRR